MARKRKLPDYVSVFVDRHGKERFRFRLNGFSCYLKSPNDKAAYDEALAKARGAMPLQPRFIPQSINDLLPRFYESIGFKKGGYDWKRTRKQVLEAFREEFGNDLVSAFRAKDIDLILSRKLEKQTVGKRTVGGTHAALRLREQLDLLFKFAIKQEWITTNPVDKAEVIEHKATGFYPWDEEDIARFRERWPFGTKPRLAMELVLWTGARRGDAHRAAPPKAGRIGFRASKTGKEQDLPVAPTLQRAIDAMPSVGIKTLLVTAYGKPFSRAGFGNWFKDRCRDAGLPQCSLHGLRKALARRAAGQNVQQQGLKALGQWSSDREAALYTESVNRKQLAEEALDAVIEWEREANIV